MEHAQRDPFHRFVHKIAHEVLILILMEHAQRVYYSYFSSLHNMLS